MTKNITKTVNDFASVKAEYFTNRKGKAKKSRAKYRKIVMKLWQLAEQGECYQKYAVKDSCYRIADNIKEEMMDGMFLKLSDRSSSKSYNVQKRTLRRVVEKRQAQAVYRKLGHTHDEYSNHMERTSISKCMKSIRKQQLCA